MSNPIFWVHSHWNEKYKRKVWHISTESHPGTCYIEKIQGQPLIFASKERAYKFVRGLRKEDLDSATWRAFRPEDLYS